MPDNYSVENDPCESIAKQVLANGYMFKPVIKNLDPKYKQFSVKSGVKDIYQIKWSHVKGVSRYELFMSNIVFACKVDSSNCQLVGDEIIMDVDQIELGNKCLQYGYGHSQNLFDCIYHRGWNVKVRAKFCDFYGEFSDEIRGVYFQCAE